MRNNKNILITGANGFIGRVLTQRLLESNYNVKAIVRLKPETEDRFFSEECELFAINDLKADLGLTNVIKNVNVVIHLAARVHITCETNPDPLTAFRKINVEVTKKLVELAVAAKVKRFVFISTLALYVDGKGASCYVDEANESNPQSPYAISKWEAEQYLNDIGQKTDMEIVIIRPPLVYGPRVKANFLSLLKITKTGLPMPVGLLNGKRSMISVNNLVDFITCCIEHSKAANETFLISDDNDISTKELFVKLIKSFGKRPLLLPIPPKILYFFGVLLGKKRIVDRLCAPLQVNIAKAKTLLGWKPVQALDDGLKETVRWYEQECKLR